jgi:signal transduction histidine kinase/ligand-binding sensor domain-containing protein
MNASLRASLWLGGLAALLLAGSAVAAPPLSLGSYQHTAFQKQDGAPGDLASIVQTADGFLWMTGTKGVTRFDGVTFQPFRPLPGEAFRAAQLNSIFPAEGGGLWIANSDAGPTLLKDGHLRHFDDARGIAVGINGFLADSQGGVWATSPQGLIRFRAGAWEMVEPNTADRLIRRAAFDSHGALWVSGGGKLMVRLPGAEGFVEVTGGPDKPRALYIERSGRIYIPTSTALHVYRAAGASLTETMAPLAVPATTVREDGEGAVWITSTTRAVTFVSPESMRQAEAAHSDPVAELMGHAEGLTGSYAWPMILDREGNIWVGTQNGVDRFRRSAFTTMKLPDGIHEVSAAVDDEGTVWVGSETHSLLRLTSPASWVETGIPRLTLATYFDASQDTVWAATPDSLWSIAKGLPVRVTALRENATRAATNCVASDSKGRVYVCTGHTDHNLLLWDGSAWTDVTTLSLRPKVIAVAGDDSLWVGAAGEPRLARIAQGVATTFGEQQGLQKGVIRVVDAEPGGVWIGGDEGIQHFDGKRFTSVGALDDDAFQTATGLARDADGNLWIQTLDGVREVESGDLARAIAAPATFVPYRSFDATDGLPGAPDPDRTLPTLRRSVDGTLWAQTASGLAWLNPRQIPSNRISPAVYIEDVTSGDATFAVAQSTVTLPANMRSFRVAYTSPMLSRPDRVRFRYRLVGYNNAWQDAGSRREAVFTNVPPGTYRFEVSASNENGVVSATTASTTIVRRAAYYETWWFRALGILPVLLLLWLVYELRTRALTRRLRIRAEEREAVARDIHDTLLQRFQGTMLTLQAWAMDQSIPGDRRAEMQEMSEQTRDALIEGRERILLLRRNEDHGLALYDQIATEGRRLQASNGMGFKLEATGTPRELAEECRNELHDIAFEALRNAFTHSHGNNVTLILTYEEGALWMVVTDDGAGFDESQVSRAREQGHFGLLGLRERVARLAGTLSVESGPGEGTELHIKLPARTAYAAFRRRWWSRLR